MTAAALWGCCAPVASAVTWPVESAVYRSNRTGTDTNDLSKAGPIVQTLRKRRATMRHDDGGFTLIELLVVIVIIGVLSAVVIFSVVGINDKGEAAACKADENTLKVAEEAHYADQGSYASESALKTAGLIEDESTLYNISLSGNDYTVSPAAGSSCTA